MFASAVTTCPLGKVINHPLWESVISFSEIVHAEAFAAVIALTPSVIFAPIV